MNKIKYRILILLAIAFIFRIFLSIFPSHVDILSIAWWGRWIYQNGPLGFFENNVWFYSWPTQPPLVNLLFGFGYYIYASLSWIFVQIGSFIALHRLAPTKFLWWFDFVRWFGGATYSTTDFPIGFIMSIKLFGILADIFIGLIVYLTAKKFNPKKALFFSALYLFSPFSFYISALWGQYDQLSYLFLLLSFLCMLNKRTLIIAPLILAISINLKPTSFIFTPLFTWFYFKQKPNLPVLAVGVISSIGVLVVSTIPFTHKNIYTFFTQEVIPRVIYKAEFRVSTNSFNFWHILIGNQAFGQDHPFLFIPARYWGYLFFGLINFWTFRICKVVNPKNVFIAMFIIGFGGWLFLTNMLERYLFAGMSSGLLLAIFYPQILKYWLVLSIVFWINLFNGWWYPDIFSPLKEILTWQEGFLTRVLSLVNVLLFFKVLMDMQIFKINLKKFRIKL